MADFLIHTAINTRRYIVDYLKERLMDFESRTGQVVAFKNPGFDHSRNWLLESISNGELPDVMLSHGSYFSVLNDEWEDLLLPRPSWTGNPSLHPGSASFEDPSRRLHPVFVVPMVPIYNVGMVRPEALSGSWYDLVRRRKGVLFPDGNTPITKIVLAYLKKTWPDEFPLFLEGLSFGGSPVEIIQAVARGEFQMGISNVSFSAMAKQRRVEILPVSEGAVPLPQVLAWSRYASSDLSEEVLRLLMDEDFQRYLGEQGLWPVVDISENCRFPVPRWKSTWEGWEDFLSGLRDLEGDPVHA
ncbi:ABC transporter substrate-binding protein [Dethiosulfovibrio sp. F2B]|uniref:ABC transporter substrate-binding protein n=1 Tax=Dethiosulfovibrio faecalis TaxID=2720018 RepID=UPI001F4861F3|nr:ABC transporter substrate-binding protein [Dethiosulfovibrio faecalis]MCF4152184.1 ABC transporter substrate-binding protein [Dethiosulfovibrio faecalis]